MSKFPVTDIIQKALKNDTVKSIDRLAWTQFNQTLLRVVAGTGGQGSSATGQVTLTTNGTATSTNNDSYNNTYAKTIVDTMKERNIPRPNGLWGSAAQAVDENRVNCWNTLRAVDDHSVDRKVERDGMKTFRIGQSAAKALSSFEPTNVIADTIDLDDGLLGHSKATATGHELLTFHAPSSLLLLAMQERVDVDEKIVGELVVPDDLVGGLTGLEDSSLQSSIALCGDELHRGLFAHRDLYDYSVLESVRSVFLREFPDTDTSLPVDDAGEVCSKRCFHGSPEWATSNDYPEREYTQAGGRTRQDILPKNCPDKIVCSGSKDSAAQAAGSQRLPANIKAYIGDDYYALAWPTTLRTFKNNLETIHQYSDTGFDRLEPDKPRELKGHLNRSC